MAPLTMKSPTCLPAALLLAAAPASLAFSPSHVRSPVAIASRQTSSLHLSAAVATPSNDDSSSTATTTLTKQQERLQQIRKEGGPLAFNTKFGAVNPYGIYYGLVSITFGLVWLMVVLSLQLFYKVTGGKIDKKRRIPVFFAHVWGTLSMIFTGTFPKIENWDIIKEFHKR